MSNKLSSCFLSGKQFTFFSLVLFFALSSFGQQKISVSGVVSSDSDKPLAKTISHTKLANGKVKTTYKAPAGVKVIIL